MSKPAHLQIKCKIIIFALRWGTVGLMPHDYLSIDMADPDFDVVSARHCAAVSANEDGNYVNVAAACREYLALRCHTVDRICGFIGLVQLWFQGCAMSRPKSL